MSLMTELLAGAVGGVAGAVAMSLVRLVGEETGLIEKHLPLYLEQQLEARAGLAGQTSEGEERTLAQGMHLAMGTTFGAGYGLLHAALGGPPLATGPLYGLGLYALNLAGVGPALNLTPEPWHEDTPTVGGQVLIHILYGTVTALVADEVRGRMQ
jgi:hypothetical protein